MSFPRTSAADKSRYVIHNNYAVNLRLEKNVSYVIFWSVFYLLIAMWFYQCSYIDPTLMKI